MTGYNFTERVRTILENARNESARLGHEYIGTEHILLALAAEGQGVASAVMENLKVDLPGLRITIDDVMKRGKGSPPTPNLPFTTRSKQVFDLSADESRTMGHHYVGTEHLLLGLLREGRGVAAQVLMHSGLNLEAARTEVLRLLGGCDKQEA